MTTNFKTPIVTNPTLSDGPFPHELPTHPEWCAAPAGLGALTYYAVEKKYLQ